MHGASYGYSPSPSSAASLHACACATHEHHMPCTGDLERARQARQQFTDVVEFLQKEGDNKGPVDIDSLEEELWLGLQSNVKLRMQTTEKFAVQDSIGVSGFSWDDARMQIQSNRYPRSLNSLRCDHDVLENMLILWLVRFWEESTIVRPVMCACRPICHLKDIISLGNNDLDSVDTAKDHPHLLQYFGLCTLGFDFDGTIDVVVTHRQAIALGKPERGLRLLFDLREIVTESDIIRAQAKVLLANLLSPEQRPALVSSKHLKPVQSACLW